MFKPPIAEQRKIQLSFAFPAEFKLAVNTWISSCADFYQTRLNSIDHDKADALLTDAIKYRVKLAVSTDQTNEDLSKLEDLEPLCVHVLVQQINLLGTTHH